MRFKCFPMIFSFIFIINLVLNPLICQENIQNNYQVQQFYIFTPNPFYIYETRLENYNQLMRYYTGIEQEVILIYNYATQDFKQLQEHLKANYAEQACICHWKEYIDKKIQTLENIITQYCSFLNRFLNIFRQFSDLYPAKLKIFEHNPLQESIRKKMDRLLWSNGVCQEFPTIILEK